MQFEEFDKKIKEAADHHHPAYDEKAWAKMKKLLDIHLPQKKDDKRRIIFFLLFFLLIAGAGLLIRKPWDKKNKLAQKENLINQITVEKSTSKKENQLSPGQNTDLNRIPVITEISGKDEVHKKASDEIKSTGTSVVTTNSVIKENKIDRNNKSIEPKYQREEKRINADDEMNRRSGNEITAINSIADVKEQEAGGTGKNISTLENVITPAKKAESQNKDSNIKKENSELKPGVTKDITERNADKKNTKNNQKQKANAKINKANSFFFSLSAGPDISFVSANGAGKMKLLAGIGLGYTFRDRLTIRSGFYSGRKVYSAGSDAYHPPDIFWTYYPYLEKVDADCKVYEIPLSVNYNFKRNKKNNWFASAGISSFIMKKETYNYFYKYTPTGPVTTRDWTINNENQHYFSVITLSGGYEHYLSKSISLIAEPYIKLPLAGVGYGKVKLNSGGVLLTLAVKPFHQAKKNN